MNTIKKLQIKVLRKQLIDNDERSVLIAEMLIDAEIKENNFNEHDTAAILFAMEFAVNNHSEMKGLRFHIEQKE